MPLENVETADSCKNRAQSAVPTLSDVALADVVVFLRKQTVMHMVEYLCKQMGKHDAAKTPAPNVRFTSGDNEPQRYHDKLYFHGLDERGNLPLENTQAADRYEYLAQSVVPFSTNVSVNAPANVCK